MISEAHRPYDRVSDLSKLHFTSLAQVSQTYLHRRCRNLIYKIHYCHVLSVITPSDDGNKRAGHLGNRTPDLPHIGSRRRDCKADVIPLNQAPVDTYQGQN